MNGLTAADVDFVLEKLKVAIDQARYDCETTSAMELEDIASTIKRLREENTTQPSRPDRVGDECWYSNWLTNESRYVWRRGILRAWLAGDDFAIIEDCETGRIECKSEITFSSEAPK
jgi:hypothetical protein